MDTHSVESDASVAAARAALGQSRQIISGAAVLIVLLTAAYLWGSWRHASRGAWNELQALSNLAQSTVQIHLQQYARGMEQLAAQALAEEAGEAHDDFPGELIFPFLHAYPDLSGVLLVRPDGKLLLSSAELHGEATTRFNGNPQLMTMLAAARGRTGLQFFPPVISPLTRTAVIRLCLPVRDATGKLRFFIVAGLNLKQQTARMRSLLTEMEINEHFGIGVLTNDGYLLENWPMPSLPEQALVEFLDQPRNGAVRQAMLRNPTAAQAAVVGPVNVGQPGIYWGMFKRLQDFPAAAFVIAPRAVVVERWWHQIRLALFMELLALAGWIWLMRRMLRIQKHAVLLSRQQAAQRLRLERLQSLYQSLLSAGDAIIKSSCDVGMLGEICKNLAQGGLFAAAWAAQPDAEGRFRCLAASSPEVCGTVDQLALHLRDAAGPAARAWLNGRLEYDNDHGLDPLLDDRRETLLGIGWKSCMAVPLKRGGSPYAVLVLTAGRAGLFDDEVATLVNLIGQQIGQGLDELDLKQSLEQERSKQGYLARHDVLTGLPNRLALMERLPRALARARRQKTMLAVGILDLDDFKPVNDTWGHAAGDAILQELGRRLSEAVRETDLVARLGGDEFAFVLESLTDVACLPLALARIHATVETPFTLSGGRSARVGLSLGVTLYPQDGAEADALLSHADTALYDIKKCKGRCADWWRMWEAA